MKIEKINKIEFIDAYNNWLNNDDGAEYWKGNDNAKSGIIRSMSGLFGIVFAILNYLWSFKCLLDGHIKALISLVADLLLNNTEVAITNYWKFIYYGRILFETEKLFAITKMMSRIRNMVEGVIPTSMYLYKLMFKTEWHEAWRFAMDSYDFVSDVLHYMKDIEDCEERLDKLRNYQQELINNFFMRIELVEEV